MLKTGSQIVQNEANGNCIVWIKFIDPGSELQKVQIPIFESPESDVIVSY
jgi:hypothetical protein